MDIAFESFANLIYRLGHPPTSKSSQQPLSPGQIFQSWLNHLSRPFPSDTGKHLFRLLFPHEGSRRRYGLRETKLALELERILCVDGLTKWDAVGTSDAGTGCLGKEIERVMRTRIPSTTKSILTIREVDKVLDDLASHSSFSQLSQRPADFPYVSDLLTRLYRDSDLPPYALCLITQIILRDLRPLLNPLPSLTVRNPTTMLRLKSTAGPAQLDLGVAMRCWHPQMHHMYLTGLGTIDACADAAERMTAGCPEFCTGPRVGTNVQIPKCLKGRSIDDALKEFLRHGKEASTEIWAETKYDGYRMQIHVEIVDDQPKICIFSKSKRDSTSDRLHTHGIILAALGLSVPSNLPVHPSLLQRKSLPARIMRRSIILEAEVVPFNEGSREGKRGRGIEEFWWLGAAGVNVNAPASGYRPTGSRHLCLVFFDMLHLDGENLLQIPLSRRRRLLEQHVVRIDGFSQLADIDIISLEHGRLSAQRRLKESFDKACQAREEGIVLKASESTYLDPRWRWVKLKKDYIKDLGDCIDLVLLGAGWNPDRARELRVNTSVFTTFDVGILTNEEGVRAKRETPHFKILFSVSYGLDRDVLESVNGCIRHGRWATKPYDQDDRFKRRLLGLSWTFTIAPTLRPPTVLFEQPLCAEVMGAGFQRLVGSKHYELRWPRLQKIFDPTLTSGAYLETAHKALGYDVAQQSRASPVTSPRDDSVRTLWRSSSTLNLVDVPDLPTPSPERPSPRRMHSAPNVLSPKMRSPQTPLVGRYMITMGDAARRLFNGASPVGRTKATGAESNNETVEDGASGIKKRKREERGQSLKSPLFDRGTSQDDPHKTEMSDHSTSAPLSDIEPNVMRIERAENDNESIALRVLNKPIGAGGGGPSQKKRRVPSLRSRIRKTIISSSVAATGL